MANQKQETIDSLWIKYRSNLEMLDSALDSIETLTADLKTAKDDAEAMTRLSKELQAEVKSLASELGLKPKEVEVIKEVEKIVEVEVIKEVEKIVEVEAKIDLSTPSAVIELEAKLAKKLNKDVSLL